MVEHHNCTPLWYASAYGRVEVIRWMILAGREIDVRKKGRYFFDHSRKECTPAEAAKKQNHAGVVSLLEKFMKNQTQVRREISDEMLRREWKALVRGGEVQKLRKFLSENPSLDVGINEVTDKDGITELLLACRNGNYELVSVLLDHPDINVNQKDKDEITPFSFAQVDIMKSRRFF